MTEGQKLEFLRKFDKGRLKASELMLYDQLQFLTDDFTGIDEDTRAQDSALLDSLYTITQAAVSAERKAEPVIAAPNGQEKATRSRTKAEPKPKGGSKGGSKEERIKDLLASLLEEEESAEIDEEELRSIVRDELKQYRLNLDNLDPEIRKRLESVTVIRYELPNGTVGNDHRKPEMADFQKIVDDVVLGNPVMLIGGAGTGKTTLAYLVATAIGLQATTLNCSQWTSPIDILGGQTLDGYQEGALIDAWRAGKLLILDELPKLDPNTAGLLNESLAKTKRQHVGSPLRSGRGEQVKRHENFAVIATGNVYPNSESVAYGANFKQDLSLLDRFSGSVYFIEENHQSEQEMCKVGIGDKAGMFIWEQCNNLRQTIVRNGYEAQVSRRLMETCRDTFRQELARVKEGREDLADSGKTLFDVLDSFMHSGFSKEQTQVLQNSLPWATIRHKTYRKILT